MNSKKYYKHLDIIRIIFFIAILFYHLGLLKGGYLAVCSFFALSGYLSCVSAFSKGELSIKKYYISRFKKIYIPLLVVVFTSIPLTLLIKDFNWINLKPEVTSVLLGYNNFWQLEANLDYFARHVSSPFMHLWYVGILLQFDLVFPFIYKLFKKIGDNVHKILPTILSLLIAIISFIFFYKSNNIMISYYNTFTRMFSIFIGLALGFFHSYYKPPVLKLFKKKVISHAIYILYIIALIVLFFTIKADSEIYKIIMLVATLITCRLIDYSIIMPKSKLSIKNDLVKNLAGISYEVYLTQYPIIFMFQYTNLSMILKVILTIILTILVSILLHMAFSKTQSKKLLKYALMILFIGTSILGATKYVTAENHSEEMKELENQLAQNEETMKQKQEEYEKNYKKEQERLNKLLEEFTVDDEKLNEMILSLPVVGVGDSVMLGATEPNLSDKFKNGYFDAKESRSGWVVNGILEDLKNKDMLGDPIVIHVGTNGDCPQSVKDTIMKTLEGKEVFWLTVTNDKDVHVNEKLKKYAEKYDNLHVIDWEEISRGHTEYFYADAIHLKPEGKKAYVQTIYDAIYEVYSQKFNAKRDEIIKQHEEEMKNKITFFGNDLLINVADNINLPTGQAQFITNKDYDFKLLKEELTKEVQDNTLNNKVVFAFDSKLRLKKEDYKELIDICNGHEIYIVSTKEDTTKILYEYQDKITIIDFSSDLTKNENYLMVDKRHLTKEGNTALGDIITNIFTKKEIETTIEEPEEQKEDIE